MFGISIPEILLLFIVILLVFGPEKLPEMASKLGRFIGEFKRGSDSIRREFYNSVYTPAEEVKKSAVRQLTTAKEEIEQKEPVKEKSEDE
ncbi:MAG: twin-arginine translocase TatA/TatE family subunit [Deltaproteobacteria bacterium]|nr:twin-arginine translocase TatA/TatE family subunit [Deltaproteobacteria bacterium]